MELYTVLSKKIIGLFGLLLCCFFLNGQANTLVIGKVYNAKHIKNIELSINKLYLNNNIEVYKSKILDDFTFAFAVQVDEPQLATIEYARNQGVIYLEPNDTLIIECDAQNFQYSFQFKGGLGVDNKCFAEYVKMNPREMSIFNMTQFKQNTYFYQVSPKREKEMLNNNINLYEELMQKRKRNALALLDRYERTHPGKLTKGFKKFFKADTRYDYAYHKLLYGTIFKNRYNITTEYFNFLEEIPLYSTQVGNQWYREFILAYFDYQSVENKDDRHSYIYQYEEASKILEDRTRAFFQSEIITRAFRTKDHEIIMDKYGDYMRYQEYGNFDLKVIENYAKALKFAGGTQAPEFSLTDVENNAITLSDYKGKVIYLNFWATWCRPCMEKMDKLKVVQPELEKEGIVFINVSLDRKEEVWKETLAKKSFEGIHVLASGELNSDIAKAYEIKVLPRYFIINKEGNFVKNPKSSDLMMVKNTLLDTNQN